VYVIDSATQPDANTAAAIIVTDRKDVQAVNSVWVMPVPGSVAIPTVVDADFDDGNNANAPVVGANFDKAAASITDGTTTPGYVYFCEAEPGSLVTAHVWRISRLTKATGKVEWANGSGAFNNAANAYSSLTYT
jgi:hypothetical protein